MRISVLSVVLLFCSCATTLPVPDNHVGHFFVAAFSTDTSDDYDFGFQYILRFQNVATKKTSSITVVPERSVKLAVKKNLQPGRYCFVGFFSEPIVERENRNYNYSRALNDLPGCFDIEANMATVWRTKLVIKQENKENGWHQTRSFKSVTANDKTKISAALAKFKNIEQWGVVYSQW